MNLTPEMTSRCGSETCETETEPGVVVAAATTAVGTDVDFVVPNWLLAETVTLVT